MKLISSFFALLGVSLALLACEGKNEKNSNRSLLSSQSASNSSAWQTDSRLQEEREATFKNLENGEASLKLMVPVILYD